MMMDLLPRLISSVRVIYSISTYYNTSERLTSLFVKITNQMITTCRGYISHGTVQRLWELPNADILHRIRQCIALNTEYQLQFRRAKEKLKETPEERQFEFRFGFLNIPFVASFWSDSQLSPVENNIMPGAQLVTIFMLSSDCLLISENYIFGKFDTFTRRLDKIIHLIGMIEESSGLEKVHIEGMDEIVDQYSVMVDTIKKRTYDMLDFRRPEVSLWINGLQSAICIYLCQLCM